MSVGSYTPPLGSLGRNGEEGGWLVFKTLFIQGIDTLDMLDSSSRNVSHGTSLDTITSGYMKTRGKTLGVQDTMFYLKGCGLFGCMWFLLLNPHSRGLYSLGFTKIPCGGKTGAPSYMYIAQLKAQCFSMVIIFFNHASQQATNCSTHVHVHYVMQKMCFYTAE